ncbi:MAG: carbohydrate ABC transporter permease [Bacillota bacterium]
MKPKTIDKESLTNIKLYLKYRVSDKPVKLFVSLLRAVFIIGVSYIILQPLLTKLSSSFMVEADLYDQTVVWIPSKFTLEHYRTVWEHMNYSTALFNSFTLSTVVSTLQLFSCTLVGYGLARFNFKGSSLLFGLVIFTLIVPPQLIMIPLYLNFRFFNLYGLLGEEGINLLGSYWPYILTSITSTGLRNGLFIYIMRQFFKGMPRGLEEAAYVDGAGPYRTFFRIMLPGALPGMIIVFLFAFVWTWNDYFFMNLFVGGKGEFLTQALDGLALKALEGDHNLLGGQYSSLINNTGSLFFITPLLLLYAFLQRYFIESVERTGMVG